MGFSLGEMTNLCHNFFVFLDIFKLLSASCRDSFCGYFHILYAIIHKGCNRDI